MNNKVRITSSQFSPILYLFAGVFFFLTSCDSAQERQSKVMTYYDLKGFMESQISTLNKEKPKVTKTMHVSGKTEIRTSREMDWKKELELFIQADINKPAYRNSYQIVKRDSLSVGYGLKTGEFSPVLFLKIELDSISGYPVRIMAVLRSENKLYQSVKNMELRGVVTNNQWHLTSYKISGFQKLAMMDTKNFEVTAQVKY